MDLKWKELLILLFKIIANLYLLSKCTFVRIRLTTHITLYLIPVIDQWTEQRILFILQLSSTSHNPWSSSLVYKLSCKLVELCGLLLLGYRDFADLFLKDMSLLILLALICPKIFAGSFQHQTGPWINVSGMVQTHVKTWVSLCTSSSSYSDHESVRWTLLNQRRTWFTSTRALWRTSFTSSFSLIKAGSSTTESGRISEQPSEWSEYGSLEYSIKAASNGRWIKSESLPTQNCPINHTPALVTGRSNE